MAMYVGRAWLGDDAGAGAASADRARLRHKPAAADFHGFYTDVSGCGSVADF